MPPPDSVHDGRLVGAIRSLTANGQLVWIYATDRYIGRLEGFETALLSQTADGTWQLYVRGRLIDHPSVAILFDEAEAPFAAVIRAAEEELIARAP